MNPEANLTARALALGALFTLAVAGCASSRESGTDLGMLRLGSGAHAPGGGPAPKVLIVRGKRLDGDLRLTYRDGHSYLGTVCMQSVPPTSEDDAWPAAAKPDPATLPAGARERILRAPWVAARVTRGAAPDAAIAEYCALQDRMLASAAAAYRDGRCHGLVEADRLARAVLDPRIADTARAGKNPPRIGPGQFVAVHFAGTGYRTLAVPAGWVDRDGADQPVTLQFARNEFDVLRMSLGGDSPTVVIVSTMGPSVYVGDDATEVLREIDELVLTGAVAPRPGGALGPQLALLGDEVQGEILAFARGHQGDL